MPETLKKVQGLLFRGETSSPKSLQPPSDVRASPGLAIHIPKPPSRSQTPVPKPPPKLQKNLSDGSPKVKDTAEGRTPRPYRDRLFEKLGGEYHGVEKYRLVQDENRERHWKKWGPYLSERQWVRTIILSTS